MCSAQLLKSQIRPGNRLEVRGLGLHSLSCHAAAAFISLLSSSGLSKLHNLHLQQAVTAYNSKVVSHNSITVESVLASPIPQRELSSKIDEEQFKSLLEASSPANKARLLSISAPHSPSWLSVGLRFTYGAQ